MRVYISIFLFFLFYLGAFGLEIPAIIAADKELNDLNNQLPAENFTDLTCMSIPDKYDGQSIYFTGYGISFAEEKPAMSIYNGEISSHIPDTILSDLNDDELYIYVLDKDEEKQGFVPLFNGIDLNGWTGNKTDYYANKGMIICQPTGQGTGNLYTDKKYSDFILRFEFRLTPGANNGLGIRAPLNSNAAYMGMELQILDNSADKYKNLEPWQYHGSVYGVIPAERGYLKPVGEWNYQEVYAKGSHIKIILNGVTILDGDIYKASKGGTQTIDNREHPGLLNDSGHIGFLGHGDHLEFRNIRIKELTNLN